MIGTPVEPNWDPNTIYQLNFDSITFETDRLSATIKFSFCNKEICSMEVPYEECRSLTLTGIECTMGLEVVN